MGLFKVLDIDWTHRSTTDIVVLAFTMLICIIMVMVTLGVILSKLIHPEIEMAKAAEAINNMLSTIIGALVGFISGRVYGRKEERDLIANGSKINELKTT